MLHDSVLTISMTLRCDHACIPVRIIVTTLGYILSLCSPVASRRTVSGHRIHIQWLEVYIYIYIYIYIYVYIIRIKNLNKCYCFNCDPYKLIIIFTLYTSIIHWVLCICSIYIVILLLFSFPWNSILSAYQDEVFTYNLMALISNRSRSRVNAYLILTRIYYVVYILLLLLILLIM